MGEAQIGAGGRAGQEAKLSKTSRSFVISGKNPIRQFFPLFVELMAEFSLLVMSYELYWFGECAGTELQNQLVFHF